MDKSKVFSEFGRRVDRNAKLKSLMKKAKDYSGAIQYAKEIGLELGGVLSEVADLVDLDVEEVAEILSPCFQMSYGNIRDICYKAQKGMLNRAKLGLGVLDPTEYTADDVLKTATDIANLAEPTKQYLQNIATKSALRVVDDSVSRNAAAQEKMGLKVRISRTYDDVGLRAGTKYHEPCRWCLAREGEWDSYAAALAAGAFERHDGCGCRIEYEVGKTRTWSTRKGEWIDM